MRLSIWDVLSVLLIVVLAIVGIIIVQIFLNPYTYINPFPPPTMIPVVVIPSSTATLRSLPPTWTATVPEEGMVIVPTLKSTSTPYPTATLFKLPTVTPSFTSTITRTNTPVFSPTSNLPDRGKILSQSPANAAILSKGQDLDMTWNVQNTGTTTWSTSYKIRYVSGPKSKADSYAIKAAVSVGSSVNLINDFTAPSTAGAYKVTWELVNASGQAFMTLTWSFTVK